MLPRANAHAKARDPGFTAPTRGAADLTLRRIPASLSTVKTYSTQELRRSTIKVFAAAKRDGEVRVRQGDGEEFSVQPVITAPKATPDWKRFVAEHRAWHKRVFPQPSVWTKEQVAELDRMIASDGRLL